MRGGISSSDCCWTFSSLAGSKAIGTSGCAGVRGPLRLLTGEAILSVRPSQYIDLWLLCLGYSLAMIVPYCCRSALRFKKWVDTCSAVLMSTEYNAKWDGNIIWKTLSITIDRDSISFTGSIYKDWLIVLVSSRFVRMNRPLCCWKAGDSDRD